MKMRNERTGVHMIREKDIVAAIQLKLMMLEMDILKLTPEQAANRLEEILEFIDKQRGRKYV